MTSKLQEIYNDSKNNKIPILRDKTLIAILDYIKKANIKSVLEIGTAYGYSSYAIYSQIDNIELTTIEKDLIRYQIAKSYLKSTSVKLINDDCFDYEPKNKYDLIILDGPKRNQIKLLDKYENYLNPNGTIFIDNLNLVDLKKKNNLTNSQIKIINDVDMLKNYLLTTKKYQVQIYEIDDGFAFVKRVI